MLIRIVTKSIANETNNWQEMKVDEKDMNRQINSKGWRNNSEVDNLSCREIPQPQCVVFISFYSAVIQNYNAVIRIV